MTTLGNVISPRSWRPAYWPAALLPLLALDTKRPYPGAMWWLMVALGAALAVFSPRLSARLAPFACLAYGTFGFYLGRMVWNREGQTFLYGVTRGNYEDNVAWLYAQAVLFVVAGVALLAVTGAPGGGAVSRAWRQLRGTGGQPKTVPPLLLLPVMLLWVELFSDRVYDSPHPLQGLLAPPVIVVLGLVAIARFPWAASAVAVAGTVALGGVGVLWGLHHFFDVVGFSEPWGGWTYHYGLVTVTGGPLQLDSRVAQTGNVLAGMQGLALLGFGLALAPRLLTWHGDLQLAQRAQALTQRVDRLSRTRSDATSTAVAELRRIERDLHDGAQARLVAVGMSLRAAEQLMGANPEAAKALVVEARETSSRALDDLRRLVRGIYPPVLADRGLGDAVRALALDTPLTVTTEVALAGEPPMPVAAAVYFGIAEALTNAVRHSGADTVRVTISHGGLLRATVTDDGSGGADPARGTGLAGVERRLATFDGVLAVSSPAGGPTIVIIEVPCSLTGL